MNGGKRKCSSQMFLLLSNNRSFPVKLVFSAHSLKIVFCSTFFYNEATRGDYLSHSKHRFFWLSRGTLFSAAPLKELVLSVMDRSGHFPNLDPNTRPVCPDFVYFSVKRRHCLCGEWEERMTLKWAGLVNETSFVLNIMTSLLQLG